MVQKLLLRTSAAPSLGGALATLAAFDIRQHLLDKKQSGAEVQHTFGMIGGAEVTD
ncbi:TPA: hypothetical protein ACH3X1_002299 [Trebouxia sp. C0004]